MKIERIIYGEYKANSYLVYENDEAILIDASLPVEKLEECLEKNKANLKGVFLTHAHFDHILNLKQILNKFNIQVYAHSKAIINMQDQHKNMSDITSEPFAIEVDESFVSLFDGDKIKCLSNNEVECFETVGHCESSMCFRIGDILFTGDTLFYGTCGRCDLWDSSVDEMKKSLLKIKEISNVSTYYPGHGYSMNKENAIKTIEYCVASLLN